MRAESSPGYVREPERAPRPGAEVLRVLRVQQTSKKLYKWWILEYVRMFTGG